MRPGVIFTWPLTRYRDHTAVVFKDTRLTFAQLDVQINRLSHGLLSLGLKTGHKVAVLMNNSLESAVALLAIPRAGLTYIALNTRHAAKEHAYILSDSESDAIIVDPEFIDQFEATFTSAASLKHIIVTGQPQTGFSAYHQLMDGQPETIPDVDVDYQKDLERIQYTSGTTGQPKGVAWTFQISYNVLTSVLINMDQPLGPGDVNLNCGPLTHATGLLMMVYYSKGATNIILPRFDEETVLKTIAQERVTSLLLIPTMLYRVLLSPKVNSYDLGSVNRVWYGTAPMSVARLKEGIKVFGNVFRQNYGMTEIAQPITFLGPEDHIVDGTKIQMKRLASAGKPAMGVELKVVDENGNAAAQGEIGEIIVRSNKLFKEYWKMPDETAVAFRDGWFHTQDMATLDEDGYLYIKDRKSDMIISGGFNIYPREVEEVIMTHPAVAEAVVIGVPDDLWGEAVKAIVVLREETQATEDDIIIHCKKNMASYKKPKSVDFVTQIPKNTYGKVDRRLLKTPFWKGFDRRVH